MSAAVCTGMVGGRERGGGGGERRQNYGRNDEGDGAWCSSLSCKCHTPHHPRRGGGGGGGRGRRGKGESGDMWHALCTAYRRGSDERSLEESLQSS